MTSLPLTVLGYEGPMLRAYLALMRRRGLQPERLLMLVQTHHPATGKPVGRWLPRRLREACARRIQEVAQNHWPRRLRARHPELFAAMADGMSAICDDAPDVLHEMLRPMDYRAYAGQVEFLLVRDLRDPALQARLESIAPTDVLYTGGGILPARIVEDAGVNVIHVHPGLLPHVRGADGLLWSTLVRGRPGVSCFLMNRGLDTGDVLAAREYPRPAFHLPPGPRPDDDALYRAVFSYCDPLLRAVCLTETVLAGGGRMTDRARVAQAAADGVTYHFMHPTLRRRALAMLFTCDN